MRALPIISILLFVGLFALSSSAFPDAVPVATAQSPCLPTEQVAEIRQLFSIEIDDPNLKEDLCDANNAVRKLFDALFLIKTTPPFELGGKIVSPLSYLSE